MKLMVNSFEKSTLSCRSLSIIILGCGSIVILEGPRVESGSSLVVQAYQKNPGKVPMPERKYSHCEKP